MKDPRFEEILFTRKEIEKRIKEMAMWVNETYKNSKDLILVGLLKGSIPFMAQLIKDINVDHILDFIVVSSYLGDVKSSGNVKLVLDVNVDIRNKDVLIVEDIVDSGITLHKIKQGMQLRNPKSVRVITLLNKPSRRKVDIKPDMYGFEVPDKFLVGFGLDIKEKMRNIPYIGVLNKKYLDEI